MKEYLQIFDGNKKPLNKKIERENVKSIKEGEYYMIVLLVIKNTKSEYLMQVTSEEKGSTVALTGGHVIFGEDGKTAIIREVREEMGLVVLPDDISLIGTKTGKRVILDVYLLEKDVDTNTLTLEKSEVERILWMNEEDIIKLIKEDKIRNTNLEAFKFLKLY